MTSDDLLHLCPALSLEPEWEAFCEHFDDPSFVAKRKQASVAQKGGEANSYAAAIAALCFHLDQHEFFFDGKILMPFEGFKTREDQLADLLKTSQKLVSLVHHALTPGVKGDVCRAALAEEAERRRKQLPGMRDRRMVCEAIEALISFIRRERRLPSRTELNLEAGRRSKIERKEDFPTPREHGAFVDGAWRVQSCMEREGIPFWDEPDRYWTLELVGKNAWGNPRWHPDTLRNNIVNVFGLKGLPRHSNRKRG